MDKYCCNAVGIAMTGADSEKSRMTDGTSREEGQGQKEDIINKRKGGKEIIDGKAGAKPRPPAPPVITHGKVSWTSFTLPAGSRYVGYVKRFSQPPIPHGYGTLTLHDGRSYAGEWFDGKGMGKAWKRAKAERPSTRDAL